MKCFVYRNLNKRKYKGTFSFKALEGPNRGRVIAHSTVAIIAEAKFVVSEKGRQRVLREKQKNVHAGIVGEVALVDGYYEKRYDDDILVVPEMWTGLDNVMHHITYDPYKYDTFVDRETKKPVTETSFVYLENGKVCYIRASE